MSRERNAFDTALTFIPLFSGTLSILGASAVLYNILSDPKRRFTTPFFRIMFGLSVADVSYAISRMFSTFAAPKGTPGLFYALGNEATCNTQGFFIHLGMIQPLYNASLCLHYLFVIKYNKSDEFVAKYLEPYMHVTSIGYPLIGAVVCASLGLFTSNPHGCWLTAHPRTIHDHQSYSFLWIFSGTVLVVSYLVIVTSLTAIVVAVRNRIHSMKPFRFGNSDESRSIHLERQYHAVTRQAILFIGAFSLAWFVGSLYRILAKRSITVPVLLLLAQILTPMQGFFHFIIYLVPRYIKSKDEHGEQSFWWLLRDAMITTTHVKNERRVQTAQQRLYERRKSLRLDRQTTSIIFSPSSSEPTSPNLAIEEEEDVQILACK